MLSSIKYSFSTWLNWISGAYLKALTNSGHLYSAQIKQIVQCSMYCITWKALNCSWEQTYDTTCVKADEACKWEPTAIFQSVKQRLRSLSKSNSTLCKYTPVSWLATARDVISGVPGSIKGRPWHTSSTFFVFRRCLYVLVRQKLLVERVRLLKVAGCAHYGVFARLKKTDKKLCSFLILSQRSMRSLTWSPFTYMTPDAIYNTFMSVYNIKKGQKLFNVEYFIFKILLYLRES